MTPTHIHDKNGSRWLGTVVVAILLSAAGPASLSGQTAPLFPTPFVVEHHAVQTDPDGSSAATEVVTDYYGGSALASVRPDGSRLIVDFSRRELTEIRPEASTYTSLSFDRYAELRARLRAARETGSASPDRLGGAGRESLGATSTSAPSIVVTPLGSDPARGIGVAATAAASAPALLRMRVTSGPEAPAIEVWCDRRVLLGERARAALAVLEAEVLAGGSPRGAAAMLAAARDHAGGAFPVRTSRRTGAGQHSPTIEDVATRLEPLDRFPDELLRIPDGYRRVGHPLEVMVAHEEQEAALARGERPLR